MEGLAAVLLLYALLVLALESPFVFTSLSGGTGAAGKLHLSIVAGARGAPARPAKEPRPVAASVSVLGAASTLAAGQDRRQRLSRFATGLDIRLLDSAGACAFADLDGLDPSAAAVSAPSSADAATAATPTDTRCPHSIALTADELVARGRVVEPPCGLALGSHVTVAATPRAPHEERNPAIAVLRDAERPALVSQFMVELQGLRAVVEGFADLGSEGTKDGRGSSSAAASWTVR